MPVETAGKAISFDCPAHEGGDCAGYAIQGLTPAVVLLPESEAQAAAALAACNAAGSAVAPWGGGTLQNVGNRPERLDAVLSLERLNRIVSYEPADLTISVEAGCTLRQLREALEPNGQLLPFDAACPEKATIGGLIATNLAGPRRFGPGSYRDLLIGVTVAAPDGVVTKAGGLVVKNVSGYDLMKLHLGALGALGLLLRLNFKVLTRPALDATATVAGERSALLALAAQLAGSQLLLDSLELLGPGAPMAGDADWRLAARLTGSEQGVARKRLDLTALCAEAGLACTWSDGDEATAWWQSVVDFLSPATAGDDASLLRLTVPPADLGDAVEHVRQVTEGAGLACRMAAHAGNGTLSARLNRGLDGAVAGVFQALGVRWGGGALLAAPAAVKADLDVWGPLPTSFPLMRRIKEQFDPQRTLNPGRLLGRL